MKNGKLILGFLLAIASMACDRVNPSDQISRIDPSRVAPPPKSDYTIVNPGDADPVLFTMAWSETEFYTSGGSKLASVAPVIYDVQMDVLGNNFDNPISIASTTHLTADIKTKEFDIMLLDSLKATAGKKIAVELRVLTKYGQNGRFGIVSENTVAINFTPYQDRNPLQMLFLYGDFNSWNSSDHSKMLAMFKTNSEKNNHSYTLTAYFPAGSFRIVPSDFAPGGLQYFDKGGGAVEFVASGSNFSVASAGYKTLTLNLRSMMWSLEDYDASTARTWNLMGFIGSFCNWENEPLMTKFSSENPHIWHLGYELAPLGKDEVHSVKFRAERSWGSRWAALEPEGRPYGRTIFLQGDEADPNVVLREGGNYDIWFNDITGLYIINKQ